MKKKHAKKKASVPPPASKKGVKKKPVKAQRSGPKMNFATSPTFDELFFNSANYAIARVTPGTNWATYQIELVHLPTSTTYPMNYASGSPQETWHYNFDAEEPPEGEYEATATFQTNHAVKKKVSYP